MNSDDINIHSLSNGMTLVAQTMQDVSSAAFVFLTPAGVAYDPSGRTGTANVLSELILRGAGSMDNRTLNDRLDGLGLQRHGSVGCLHTCLGGALVGDNLLAAIELYSEILCRPTLAESQFELCRELSLQVLASLEDDPRQKIALLAHERYLPEPFGRPSPGKRQELQALTLGDLKNNWSERYRPDGTILAAAGNVDFGSLVDMVERCFGAWQGSTDSESEAGPVRIEAHHQHHDGAQVHIAVLYPSVSYADSDYYRALAAVAVLSGGMGSRLFTEVREKRGLCYAVGANHRVIGPYAAIQCYVGSSPEQAQEAVDVLLAELKKLPDGISEDELDRARVGLKASLIMSGESTGARAMACAGDYYHLGRVRSLKEIEKAINELTVDDVVEHVRRYRPADFAVTTLGPTELKTS